MTDLVNAFNKSSNAFLFVIVPRSKTKFFLQSVVCDFSDYILTSTYNPVYFMNVKLTDTFF